MKSKAVSEQHKEIFLTCLLFSFFFFSYPISSVIFHIKVHVKSWWMIKSSPCCYTAVLWFLGFVPSKFKYCLGLFFWTISFSNLNIQLFFFFVKKNVCVCVCAAIAVLSSDPWNGNESHQWWLSDPKRNSFTPHLLWFSRILLWFVGLEKHKIKNIYWCFPQVPRRFWESVWGFWLVSRDAPKHILK